MKKVWPLLILFIFGCSGNQHVQYRRLPHQAFSVDKMPAPPGTVRLGTNMFIDDSEISNFSYCEFLWWTKHTYGAESKEYKNILPDQMVWFDLDKHYLSLTDHYLYHPAYRDYPAVGIRYDQARAFCKWRSDRVMESMLVYEGVIDYRPFPIPDSCFTIERYFNGQYPVKKANPNIIYYPVYDLPDSAAFMWTLNHLDSLHGKHVPRCYKKSYYREALTFRCYDHIDFKNDTLPYSPDPATRANCYECFGYILHLQGNVREMTRQQGLSFGGCYKDSCALIKRQNFFRDTTVNAYTGFRCVCHYETWDKGQRQAD